MIRFFSPVTPLLKGWLLSFAAFGLLAFVVVGQFALAVSMPLSEALRMAGRDWLPWAVAAPLLFRLVTRLPLERERWKLAWPVHLLCALATALICTWWAERVLPPRFGPRRTELRARTTPPPQSAERSPRLRSPSPPRRNPFSAFFLIGFRLPIYLAIVSLAHALHFYRRSKDRERRSLELEASLAKARLEALKMQLQPHFLFNSLNAIAELVHHDPKAADEMITALSHLLRLTLETSGEQELPLRRELEFVERYLAIERVRFGERLHFSLEIAPDTQTALVPTFLLQPLVENAVRHGLAPHPHAGRVTVRAHREDDRLHLSVSDDGVGLPASPKIREGIGLANTRARLRELYDGHASLELRAETGLHVSITLPFHTTS